MIRKSEDHPDNGGAGIEAALLRAAGRAREIARQHGTPLVIWEDGRVCEVHLNELSQQFDKSGGGDETCRK